MKKTLCLILALAMLLSISSALADPKKIDGISDRGIVINTAGLNAEPDEMIAQGISPTTGRNLEDITDVPDGFMGVAVSGIYQPMMVQISNSMNGIGVNNKGIPYQYAPVNASYADVVYESVQKQEGTESRMTMLFSDLIPDYVGFVRSTRLSHVFLRQEWNCAFCTSGYSDADVPEGWRETGVKSPQTATPDDPGLVYVGDYPKVWKDYVWRLYPLAGPNNEVFMLADIVNNIVPKDHKAANHTWLFTDEVPEGGILVPTPIILRTVVVVNENGEDADATVYGNFWIFTYTLEGKTLKTHSGGENAGVLKLEKKNGEWSVTGSEFAEDGEKYAESIRKFANGDEQLEKDYYDTTGASENSMLPQYQRAVLVNYVVENKLDITAYQDYGYDPVSLID